MVEHEKTQTLPDIDAVKPASNIADYHSVSALVVLRVSKANDFKDASGYWVSQLMHAPCIFYEKLTGTYYMSFGVYGNAGISWEVTPFGNDSEYFCLSSKGISAGEAAAKLQFFTTKFLWHPGSVEDDEEYTGVPTQVCFCDEK